MARRSKPEDRLKALEAADKRTAPKAAPVDDRPAEPSSQIGARIPVSLHRRLREVSVLRRNTDKHPWQLADIVKVAIEEWLERNEK